MANEVRNLAYVGITLCILVQFLATCASHRIAPIQLAYGVMTYERVGQLAEETIQDFMRLMNQIYEDANNHIYVLHTDLKSSLFVISHVNAYCDSKVNCISIDSRSVTWGGVSVTEMNLALMHAADDFLYPNGTSSSWDYFCLLGHESVPLTTLEYTEQLLLSYPKGTNFINCWKADGHDFFGQWESLDYRLTRVVIDSTGESVLHEPNIERSVPSGLEIYKSLQYVVLSREFIR
jgi:Core-2/I-Branching enzyme